MSDRTLTADGYRALAEFRYQIRQFLQFSEKAVRSAGLNPQHHQLLLALSCIPKGLLPSINEIARRLHLRHHSVVELTNRLTARDLFENARIVATGIGCCLEITARGEAVLRKLSLIHRAPTGIFGQRSHQGSAKTFN